MLRRDPGFPLSYWNDRCAYLEGRIATQWNIAKGDDVDRGYLPQYVFDIAVKHLSLMLLKYSRGDEKEQILPLLAGLIDAWEQANLLGETVWTDEERRLRNAWRESLDAYNNAFNIVGFALLLGATDDQWRRLLRLVGNEGEDALLDRVIASRQPGRRIGGHLCHPQAYMSLLAVTMAEETARSEGLASYVDGWFASLENAGLSTLPRSFRTPWWWTACKDPTLAAKGAYLGCWCVEAAAVAKVFAIDDRAVLAHPHYPGDLIEDGRSPRYPDVEVPVVSGQRPGRLGWLMRWAGRL